MMVSPFIFDNCLILFHAKNMKMKLLKIGVILGSLVGMSNAATITVTQGFGAQGLVVTSNGIVSLPNFFVGVGGFTEGSTTFTHFGTSILDTGKVNGVFEATSPASLQNRVINLFVGDAATLANSFSWVLLSSTVSFPPDVTEATGVTFNATVGNNLTLVGSQNATWSPALTLGPVAGNGMITFIPEPSAALLGAFGALGLLRRRRI
jgi:hypothetical protein